MKFKNKKTGEIKEFEPLRIDAALVSAQRRVRLFWTNIPNVTQPADRGIFLKDILEPKSNTVRSSGRGSEIYNKHNWDTIRIGTINKGGRGDRIYSPEGKSVGLSANGGGRGGKDGAVCSGTAREKYHKRKKKRCFGCKNRTKNRIGQSEKAHTITSVFKDSMIMENSIIRKFSPVECERLMTLPDFFTETGINEKGEEIKIRNSQRYKMLGNGFVVDVVAHILKGIPK